MTNVSQCGQKLGTDASYVQAKVCPNISIVICDDIYVKIYSGGTHNRLLCRFSMNTAFVDKKKYSPRHPA
ncbi:MAG: hypothetical protein P4M11_14900 [Candidatus Pacebacteria bacterium]|nr:hypothetical protein [Candidatus Paceibacterota bacterium]